MPAPDIIIVLNGLNVEVTEKKVSIIDNLDDVSDEEAKMIVRYLYREGFISKKTITCEIIRADE